MKKFRIIISSNIIWLSLFSCTNNNSSEKERSIDSINTMPQDGQDLNDSISQDTLSSDSIILPTPVN
ncbi:hypothetical protein ACFRAE_08755 [Sphingobacterium sp. HJSM2_6]